MLRRHNAASKPAGWQAAFLILLIVSADSGVEALREHALRGDAAGRISSPVDDEVSKAMRAVERAEAAAQAAAIRHNRALSNGNSFADAALDSKAVFGADAGTTVTSKVGEPFIAGAIIILTLASMIMKAVTATKRATFQMMQGKYSEQMHLILDETNQAVAQINDRFDDVFGEVTRQMSDLVRDVGVSAVQLLSNDRVLSAADHAVKRIDAALQPPPTTASEEEVSLWHRYTSSPHINKLKDAHAKVQLVLATAKGMKPMPPIPDELMGNLRAALAKVVAGDYAVIHSAGQLSAKASFDASKLGKYVFLVDPAAMQKVFSLVLTSSAGAPLRAMTEDEARVEGLMRRMSHAATMRVLSKGRGGESSLDAGMMAEQRAATLAIRNIKAQGSKGLAAKEKEVEGVSDTLEQVNDDIAEVVDMAEQGNDILKAFSEAGGEEALAALKVNPELISTVTQSLQLVGAIVSVIASSMTLYRLAKDADIAEFEFARASGIAGERHIVAVRRATAATCRLMDSLRAPLKDVINGRALDLLKGEQGSPQFWKALGLPLTLKDVTDPQGSKDVQLLSDNARKRVSVTVATRFCGIFAPMLARMEELFSPAGECVTRLQATAPQPDKDLLAVTGAADVSAQASVRATSQHVLGKAPSLAGGDFAIPRVETCVDADIYDVAVAADDGTAKELAALGYARMADIDAGWAPKGDKFLTFGGDLNRHLAEPKKAADALTGWAHPNQMSTVFILTCKALHATAKAQADALQANPKLKPSVDKILGLFALLKYPVTDVTFAVRYPDEVEDHKSAQAKLQAAGYQMLHLSDAGLAADDLAFNFAADIKGRAAATPKYDTCKKHNVRRGIRENKALVTVHVLRGGLTPLQDMRLAPFVSVSSLASGLMSSSAAAALGEAFLSRNQKALAAVSATAKPPPSAQTMGTRWYAPGKSAAGSTGAAMAADKAVSMVAPPTCADSWDTVTRVDAKWKKQSLFQLLLNKEGNEADVTFYKHSFNPRCAVDANARSVWERVAVSPFPDNDRKEAVAQKPYLWLLRRYAIPTFAPLLEDVASCPWECADALKGVVLPPAALYASATSLQQLHKAFAIDADIKVQV